MFTIQEAWQIQHAAERAASHEKEIDRQLRQAIMSRGIMFRYVLEGDKTVAEYLRERYETAGWKARLEELEPDRAYRSPVEYTLHLELPPDPNLERGGPGDR